MPVICAVPPLGEVPEGGALLGRGRAWAPRGEVPGEHLLQAAADAIGGRCAPTSTRSSPSRTTSPSTVELHAAEGVAAVGGAGELVGPGVEVGQAVVAEEDLRGRVGGVGVGRTTATPDSPVRASYAPPQQAASPYGHWAVSPTVTRVPGAGSSAASSRAGAPAVQRASARACGGGGDGDADDRRHRRHPGRAQHEQHVVPRNAHARLGGERGGEGGARPPVNGTGTKRWFMSMACVTEPRRRSVIRGDVAGPSTSTVNVRARGELVRVPT